jgi:hypothetical protein
MTGVVFSRPSNIAHMLRLRLRAAPRDRIKLTKTWTCRGAVQRRIGTVSNVRPEGVHHRPRILKLLPTRGRPGNLRSLSPRAIAQNFVETT